MRPSHTGFDEPLDPLWREEATVVGDFAFGVTDDDFPAWRPHEKADFQFKLPIMIEGHLRATVWVPRSERDRVGLIVADVPRRGVRNSYRVEDGHLGVGFEPCAEKEWTAWTAGLALADRRHIVLMVRVDDARRPERVPLGPWEVEH
jgi:hypothetical protein